MNEIMTTYQVFTLFVSKTNDNLVGSSAKKWYYKRDRSNPNKVLYVTSLAGLIANVQVSFYLLFTGSFLSLDCLDLNFYYCHIIECLKRAEEIAVSNLSAF